MDKEETVEELGYIIAEQHQRIEELENARDDFKKSLEWDNEWTRHSKLEDDGLGLPVPRLELRAHEEDDNWQYEWRYGLVYQHLTDHTCLVPLGATRTSGGSGASVDNEPFRDSAHIRSEMKSLGLRGFVICGDSAVEINSENRDQIAWIPDRT